MLNIPTHPLTLSNGKEIEIRSFSLAEEKEFMMLKETVDSLPEGKDPDQKLIINTLLKIVDQCVMTEGFDVGNVPQFDFDWIFIQLRAISVSDTAELIVSLKGCKENECENEVKLQIDYSKIEQGKKPEHSNKIEIEPNVILTMSYPTYGSFKVSKDNSEYKTMISNVIQCAKSLQFGDDMYKFEDFSEEERIMWFEQFNHEHQKRLFSFWETMPKIQYEVEVTCDKCGATEKVKIEGLENFL